jgi:hypothetical protein
MTNQEVINKYFGKIIGNKLKSNILDYHGGYYLKVKCDSKDIHDFLSNSFIWSNTPEGNEYWFKKAQKGEGVKICNTQE